MKSKNLYMEICKSVTIYVNNSSIRVCFRGTYFKGKAHSVPKTVSVLYNVCFMIVRFIETYLLEINQETVVLCISVQLIEVSALLCVRRRENPLQFKIIIRFRCNSLELGDICHYTSTKTRMRFRPI